MTLCKLINVQICFLVSTPVFGKKSESDESYYFSIKFVCVLYILLKSYLSLVIFRRVFVVSNYKLLNHESICLYYVSISNTCV